MPHARTATVGVWIDAGSRFETDANNGTAHFLEHMAFKGTKRRTTAQLEEEVENMGAHLNAYTSREQTTYYAKTFAKDVPAAVDILADILQNSSLNEAAIERERNVILREMEEVEKESEEVLFDHLHATAFQHSPLGRTILGPSDNIRSITKADLADYIATHYTAPRMVVVGAGAVDHDALCKLAESAFSGLPTTPTTAKELAAREPSTFTGSSVSLRDDDAPLAHFAVSVKGASWADPDSVTLMVMQAMLGSWDATSPGSVNFGSKLAQRIASNKLAKSMMAFNTNYTDTGLFGVHVATDDPDHIDDLAWCVMREFGALAYDVEEDDLLRAKEQLKSSLLLHVDSSTSALAEDIGRQVLTYGRRLPLAELFARIDAVNVASVKAAGRRFITDQEVAVSSMGPTGFLPDLNWFRRRTYWLSQ